MTDLFDAMSLARGPGWKNRLMLAPLTNQQSHDDGTLSDDELRWLTMRAEGGFAMTPTCAAHVQEGGRAFDGQLGIFDDRHIPGLTRLADAIRSAGAVSCVQLHHGGMRAVVDPVSPSGDEETGARALSLDEVERARDAFVAAARRAEAAGFDGVEVHGAHGYLLCEFLSPEYNRRDDRYGGGLQGRVRLVQEIVSGIRETCRADFQIGLRLSPERFGQVLTDSREIARQFLERGAIDYLDLSLWDVEKQPAEAVHQGRSLLSYFTDLHRGDVRLGAAGTIGDGAAAARALGSGLDFVVVGKAGILVHDFPRKLAADRGYAPPAIPVGAAYLQQQGLGEGFISYMRGRFEGFVAD